MVSNHPHNSGTNNTDQDHSSRNAFELLKMSLLQIIAVRVLNDTLLYPNVSRSSLGQKSILKMPGLEPGTSRLSLFRLFCSFWSVIFCPVIPQLLCLLLRNVFKKFISQTFINKRCPYRDLLQLFCLRQIVIGLSDTAW